MTGELQEMVERPTAITEKRPNRVGGCVGVFFQLFDWNRRFGKKKLFSRKSLLNGKQDSKRFGRNEKMLKSKNDDEKRGIIFPVLEAKKHEMKPPSLVARLMGLESMPSNQRDKGNKNKKMKKTHDKDRCNLFESEEIDIVCDRRVVAKKFGTSDALQIKNVLTRVRKHHHNHHHQKLASPVRSPRMLQRRNSRLIYAASRILEPGGKRNTKYCTRRLENVGKDKEPVGIVVPHDSLEFQRGYNNSGSFVSESSSSLPFERNKRNVFWRNQETSTNQLERGKALQRVDRCEFNGTLQRNRSSFPQEVRFDGLDIKGGSPSFPSGINFKEKGFIDMNKGLFRKNPHSRVDESCSSRSGLGTPARKRRLASLNEGRGIVSVSSVSRRLDGESSCACRTRGSKGNAFSPSRNHRAPFPKRQPINAATLGLIQQKVKYLATQEGSNSWPHKSASLILHELLSSVALEQPYIHRKGKTEMWTSPIGNAHSEYTSPVSVLDASFSNESCFSNSIDNISVPGQVKLSLEPTEPDWDFLEEYTTSGGNYQAIASLVKHVSNVLRSLSNTGLILTHQRFNNARKVIIHTELLLGTTQENYLIGPELFDEFMIYTARYDLHGITGGFLVDAMIEHLEELEFKPLNAESSGLIRGVLEKVPKWGELARIGMDEVVSMEMEKWIDLETHLFGLCSEIAYEIFWCLVGELTIDLF